MKESHTGTTGQGCLCPYCEHTVEMSMPFCRSCGTALRFCSTCGLPIPKEATKCSKCGQETGSPREKD